MLGTRLVNGAELKQLIKEHLNRDVISGTSPPRRLRASGNTQTGQPGPPIQDRASFNPRASVLVPWNVVARG